MADPVVSTMSTLGFIVESVPMQMDKHIAYYFAARRNQSKIIPNVPSFEWTLKKHQGNKEDLKNAIKLEVIEYFKQLYEWADVQTVADPDDRTTVFTLGIAVMITHKGKRYDLNKSVLISGKTYEIINEGRVNELNE